MSLDLLIVLLSCLWNNAHLFRSDLSSKWPIYCPIILTELAQVKVKHSCLLQHLLRRVDVHNSSTALRGVVSTTICLSLPLQTMKWCSQKKQKNKNKTPIFPRSNFTSQSSVMRLYIWQYLHIESKTLQCITDCLLQGHFKWHFHVIIWREKKKPLSQFEELGCVCGPKLSQKRKAEKEPA